MEYSGEAPTVVGRVLRASTTGFDCGARSSGLNGAHAFGSFVKAPISEDGALCAVGLIYGIRIDDDPLARELVMASAVNDYTLFDQRENRMAPVEICVLAVGYFLNGYGVHALPPRPPMSMAEVVSCSPDEVLQFTGRSEFFRHVLNAREAPCDSLLAACIRSASLARADHLQYDYLVDCGRACATLLCADLQRLSGVLALLDPAYG
ncbi:MAG TPA: hypothetical protein VER79_03770 [Candidatus Limnocylindrales bacterium]|nr:hypothetical protein [Candidatus Limnocylindrales bacterium]